jgi:hypothetical protein
MRTVSSSLTLTLISCKNMMATILGFVRTSPLSLQVLAVGIVLALLYSILTGERPYPGIPIVKVTPTGWKRILPTKFGWILQSEEIIEKGRNECPGCFQVLTGTGYKIVLPSRFANEIKNNGHMSFNEAFQKEFPTNYPGFDAFTETLKDGYFMQTIVRRNLTQSLALVTDDLVDETLASVHDILGEERNWQTRLIKQDLLNIVARLSSRVFLGVELCRDPDWLRISKEHTVDIFIASRQLKLFPKLLQPIVHWFIPTCRKLRREVRLARRLILPEVERRTKRAQTALEAGEKPPKAADTIGWMVENAHGREVDYVASQLALTLAAIHTTSETMAKCKVSPVKLGISHADIHVGVMQLCTHPETIEPLRNEMHEVLRSEGWSKVALYKMKLLDSFLKEVQRTSDLSTSQWLFRTKTSIR